MSVSNHRLMECVAKCKEYVTNVWKMKCHERQSSTGSHYLDAFENNTLIFTIRVSNHAPGNKDDGVIICDPNRDPIGTLSYIAFKFGLRDTQDIRNYRAYEMGQRVVNGDKAVTISEMSVIETLMRMVDAYEETQTKRDEYVEEIRKKLEEETGMRIGAVNAQKRQLKRIDELEKRVAELEGIERKYHALKKKLQAFMED